MRQPTPARDLFAWHRAALAGEEPSVQEDWPECGWYRHQFKKGGPWLPVEIRISRDIDPETGELDGDEQVHTFYLGQKRSDAVRLWTWLANHPISRERYKAMVAVQFDVPDTPLTPTGHKDLTQEIALP